MTEHELLQQLRDLAKGTPLPDGEAMEGRLRTAFATRPHTAPAARRWGRDYVWAAAAALLLLSGTLVWHVATIGSRRAPAASADSILEFVAVPGAAALPDLESARIVRVELAPIALPAYGFELPPDAIDAPVAADVLVGQDGLPRGIRLIP